MARYTEAKCRLCRREGVKLFLKGARCNTEKCPFVKRPYAPGMHGKMQRRKPSYYALQLREKQKVKRMYGVLEKQFRRFFSMAARTTGATGGILIQLLERRLDNVVYRSLCAFSRYHARQMVGHGFIFVNARRVNIPSYLIKAGDVIEIRGPEEFKKTIKAAIEATAKERSVPEWLEIDNDKLAMKITRIPVREDLTIAVNEQLIVELYSK